MVGNVSKPTYFGSGHVINSELVSALADSKGGGGDAPPP